MKNKCSLLGVLGTVFLLMAFCSCSEKEDDGQREAASETNASQLESSEDAPNQPDDSDTTAVAAVGASLKEVIALWDAGRQEEARRRFLAIDWQDASVFQGTPGLTISEGAYLALSRSEQQRVGEETMALLASMRKLFFQLATEAERLAEAENRAEAEEYLEAVRRYGSSLSGSDHFELVRMHGKAATDYAEKKLSELK